MILSFETSSEPASLSFFDGKTLTTRHFPNNNQVNISFANEIDQLIRPRPQKLNLILVGAGPGSYSGTRVGLATAEAMGLVFDCPVVTIPSFYGISSTPSAPPLALIGDARRHSYFTILKSSQAPFFSSLSVLEKLEFEARYQALKKTHRLVTFEARDKLPVPTLDHHRIELVSSSSEQLLRYWQALDKEHQDHYLSRENEIVYLRPPHITRASSPLTRP